jgi:peptidoglycan hydrolase-like protein with peptidoglycan-binding domain
VTTGFSRTTRSGTSCGNQRFQEAPTLQHQNDAKSAQQALHDRGHYSDKVDGTFGLRTLASIRAYQKAENLPITGQVEAETTAALGVRPESTWGTSQSVWSRSRTPDQTLSWHQADEEKNKQSAKQASHSRT